ncbi:MAG: hypothetical protein V2I97_01010 [Desulfococcaceae bacterium]|jgi:hypothetical protein|nr:hypothetical protein [Desulfococcaceae bacterium]
MKIWTIFLLLPFFTLPCYADEDLWNADTWGRERFEMKKIQQRTENGFTNRGRVLYKYVDDSNLDEEDPMNIGAVRLNSSSSVREVYVGVDINQQLRFDGEGNSLNIGTVETYNNRQLRKTDIRVNLEQPVTF